MLTFFQIQLEELPTNQRQANAEELTDFPLQPSCRYLTNTELPPIWPRVRIWLHFLHLSYTSMESVRLSSSDV